MFHLQDQLLQSSQLTEATEENKTFSLKRRGRPRKQHDLKLTEVSLHIEEPKICDAGGAKRRGRPRKIVPEMSNPETSSDTLLETQSVHHFLDEMDDEANEENIEIVIYEDSTNQKLVEDSTKCRDSSNSNQPSDAASASDKSCLAQISSIEPCQQDVCDDETQQEEHLDAIEDEVNIVIFDESESVLPNTEQATSGNKILIESDNDTDSTVADLSDYTCKQSTSGSSSPTYHAQDADGKEFEMIPILVKAQNDDQVHELQQELKQISITELSSQISISVSNSTQCSEADSEDTDLDQAEIDTKDEAFIRRSRRIKKISSFKKRSIGHGLVRDRSGSGTATSTSNTFATEALDEMDKVTIVQRSQAEIEEDERVRKDTEERLKKFVDIKENEYKCDRNISKEAKRMLCDCFLTEEEIERDELGCGEDCLNRLLMIECGPKCNVGDRCTNQRFQKMQYAECTVFRTEKKGFGVHVVRSIQPGAFIMEYIGEVLDGDQFEKRAAEYSKLGNEHYYFMALRSDAIIDATTRGNISRFINHSCDPNSETQKWTVNGELRIGFFSKRFIPAGDELTFDYQFQRYGKEAQKCFCESKNCRGWIGKGPCSDSESDEPSQAEESEDEPTEPELLEKTQSKPKGTIGKPQLKKVQPEKPKKFKIKIERKKRNYNVRKKKDILHDTDLNDEISDLMRTGLKNQLHTLKLSRLMVRAEHTDARAKLLQLLITGELPCRRLFLDYHGLRILNGWMESCHSFIAEPELRYRKAILAVLQVLPISNKTILKDSKVLATTQKWADDLKCQRLRIECIPELQQLSPNDSSNDSKEAKQCVSDNNQQSCPQSDLNFVNDIPSLIKQNEQLIQDIDMDKLKEIMDICGSKQNDSKNSPPKDDEELLGSVDLQQESSLIFEHDKNVSSPVHGGEDSMQLENLETTPGHVIELQKEILETVTQLLKAWECLKDNFRIPKKERIEQMKEHEREADLRYQALKRADYDQKVDEKRTSSRYHRDEQREKRLHTHTSFTVQPDDKYRLVYGVNLNAPSSSTLRGHMSKQQRRQMFEMQVAQEETEREIWNCHVQNCIKFGLDPHITPPSDIPAMMNPITGQYYSFDHRPVNTPPSHVRLFKFQ